jgi:hypothetical protein
MADLPRLTPAEAVIPRATIPQAVRGTISLVLIVAVPVGAVLLLNRAVAPHWAVWPDGPWRCAHGTRRRLCRRLRSGTTFRACPGRAANLRLAIAELREAVDQEYQYFEDAGNLEEFTRGRQENNMDALYCWS